MPYRNTATGEFGLSEAAVRLLLADRSLPEDLEAADLAEFDVEIYAAAPTPVPAWNEHVEEIEPVDGVQQWRLVPNGMTEDDLRRAQTPAEVMNYQAQIVMKLTTLQSLGLDPASVGLPNDASLWDAVLAAVATLDPQPRLVAETQLASAPGFQRSSMLIEQLAPVVGLTEAMIDNLFIAAKAIP